MRIFYSLLALILTSLMSQPSSLAALVSEEIEYVLDDKTFLGYLAYDDALAAKRPGILVIHEWKGLGDYAKKRANELAGLGYAAFAADMYGKGVRAESHEQASAMSKPFLDDRELMRKHAQAALDVLRHHAAVDSGKLAAIGYCFGGTTVLEMARAGMEIKGAVSFHGGLATSSPAEKGNVKAQVMVFHGAKDGFVADKDMDAFKSEMTEAEADWQFVTFSGAVHSFTVKEAGDDPSDGIAYNEKADQRSWAMLKIFLDEIFS